MDITLPCTFCKYLNRSELGTMTCIAFPNGIPKDIQELKVIHNSPYPGDNGIRYEKLSEKNDYFKYFNGELRS